MARGLQTVKYNKERLRDKIYACWIGKNIGGTIGTPFEGTKEFLDVKGFTSKPGEPLPNDDLDLQLVWLIAMEQEGPWYLNSRMLGEYWLSLITPYWNEYGVGKANLYDGVPAPLSGELYNQKWRDSNGAWIRSEIWATLTPGFPMYAREYAFADATVDHGMGEGTYAEIFTASLESKAFFMTDMMEIVLEGLKSIPETCRVYKAVKLVVDEYNKGTPYREVREMLVKQSEDIGWFQAPANLGYVTIGLLYGEGDFKKSVLYAVNCGDDTDCTAATVGSIMGIVYGTAGIPKDWAEYIGDDIRPICISPMQRNKIPKNCTELTDRVMNLIPIVLFAHCIKVEWTDGEDVIPEGIGGFYMENVAERGRYCFEIPHTPYLFGFAEFDREPIVKAGEQIKIKLNVNAGTGEKGRCRAYCDSGNYNTTNYNVKVITPDGWNADYTKSFSVRESLKLVPVIWEGVINVGENVEAINHVYVVVEGNNTNNALIVDYVIKA